MHAIVIITTPDQTKARRCVFVRAMKSLMRMSCASVLQPRRLYNGGWSFIDTGLEPGAKPMQRLHWGFRVTTGLKASVNQNRNKNVSSPLTYRSVF